MQPISFCCPTFERYDFTVRCVDNIIDDARISEVVISDDCSMDGSYEALVVYYGGNHKVKIYRNDANRNCYLNKALAIQRAKNNFIVLIDSDNMIDAGYLDTLYSQQWDKDVIFAPEFLMPSFDFRMYGDCILTKENIHAYIDLPMLEVSLNAANYFVNRNSYIDVFDETVNPVTSDSITQSYNWLASGRKIKILKGLRYWHEIHSGSHYQQQNKFTPEGYHNSILQKLRELR